MASISRLESCWYYGEIRYKGKEIAIEGITHRSYDDKMARSAT
jgi:hypothetical protein